jgi:transcriptional regulator with XRE-family HTH domain
MNEDLLYEIVGEKVRAAREHTRPKLSQTKLAETVGLSRASVVNIEAGRQRAPLHVLWQIAEVLGTELTEFLPRQAEFTVRDEPAALDPLTAAQIEREARGDTVTRRLLTRFVSRARSQGSKEEDEN